MTRKTLVIFFASALALLWSYEIATTLNSGADFKRVTVLGLGFALGMLVVELRTAENNMPSWHLPLAESKPGQTVLPPIPGG